MKKFILASASALALLTVAACSDSADNTTTQSTTPAPVEQPAPDAMAPADGAPPPADNTTTQSIDPTPETSTGGEMQGEVPAQPAPVQPQ